jgi:hypothetical protein
MVQVPDSQREEHSHEMLGAVIYARGMLVETSPDTHLLPSYLLLQWEQCCQVERGAQASEFEQHIRHPEGM